MAKLEELVLDWQKQMARVQACESDHERCPICKDQLAFCMCHLELAQKVLENMYLEGKNGSEVVVLSKVYYESLLEDSETLGKLEAYGVDNWSGYSDALNDSEGYLKEEEEE